MKVYIISDNECDEARIVATYLSPELAEQHVSLMGGDIHESEVLEALHHDATDPVKQQARTLLMEREKAQWDAYRQRQEIDAKRRAETRPHPPHMGLCSCQTFSPRPIWNAHGYCSYCGGFAPEVFRKHMGDAALELKISELGIWEREKMLTLTRNVQS